MSLEELIRELAATVPVTKKKSKIDYGAVFEYIKKLNRPFTVGELSKKGFGPFNYLYQWVNRHTIQIDAVEDVDVDEDTPMFVRVNNVYVPVQLIKERLQK